MSKVFKIGTRGSLLAITQCTLIKEELEKLTSHKFQLELITTQGDLQTEKPLWQMDGKDFFTKELDTKLLNNEVDLVVHSYKDLGSIRPSGLLLAAVTKREFANDILLIKDEDIFNLKSKESFVVGTSSPRRIHNIENSLKDYLPNFKGQVTTKMLRGNVNTRIEKLRSGNYDAIVLAHAGIERLANKEESKKELKGLLEGLNFLVLPQKDFPSCASQGALALEINESRKKELLPILKTVHDQKSFDEIKHEREAFNSYGGGCHLAVGIHVKEVQGMILKFEHGEHNKEFIKKKEIINREAHKIKGTYYTPKQDDFIKREPISNKSENQSIFVTSHYCFHNIDKPRFIFSAGNRTAKKLIKEGYWVNGSAEGFGHQEILKLKESKSLALMMNTSKWEVFSHDQATSEIGNNLACYKRTLDNEYPEPKADIFYWTSAFQFKSYTNKFPNIRTKIHSCGLGKTFTELSKEDIKLYPFIDMKNFINYMDNNK